jgi:hypothetical protein
LADHDVAQLLDSMMGVAFRTGAVRLKSSPREPALRKARVCYAHLAGEMGVLAYEGLLRQKVLTSKADELQLARQGRAWFEQFSIDVDQLAAQRRTLCRTCLDWSERRQHLAGSLGSALLDRVQAWGWARRQKDSRVMAFTPSGERLFRALFAE